MIARAYFDQNFTFINMVDEIPNLHHTFAFEREIHRSVPTLAEVKRLIQDKGGYVVTAEGEKFSAGQYFSGQDVYICEDFSAVVYNGSNVSRLFLDVREGATYIPASKLQPCFYLANDAMRALGTPAIAYAGVGSKLFASVEVNSISGVCADYYLLDSYSLVGAYGCRGQTLPWLYYPKTVDAARAIRSVFTGEYPDAWKEGSLPKDFMSPCLGEDGVLFVGGVSRDVAVAKDALMRAKTVTNVEFAKRFIRPEWSGADCDCTVQFLSSTINASEENDVIACVFAGPDAAMALDAAILKAINTKTPLLESDRYLIDSVVNKTLREASDAYYRAQKDTMRGFNDQVFTSAQQVYTSSLGFLVDCAGTAVRQAVITSLSDVRIPWKDNPNVSCAVHLDAGLPQPAVPTSLDVGGYSNAIRQNLRCFGADYSGGSSFSFGSVCKARLTEQITPVIDGLVAAVKGAVGKAVTVTSGGTISYGDNMAEHYYTLCGDKPDKHPVLNRDGCDLAETMKVEGINVSGSGGIGNVTITFEFRPADGVWFGCPEYDYQTIIARALRDALPAGLSITYLGPGDIPSYQKLSTFDKVRIVGENMLTLGLWSEGLSNVHITPIHYKPNFQMVKELGPNWLEIPNMRFAVTAEFTYSDHVTVSPGLDDEQCDAAVTEMQASADTQGIRALIAVMQPRVKELASIADQEPIGLCGGFYCDPRVMASVFTLPSIFGSNDIDATITQISRAGFSEEEAADVLTVLRLLQNKLEIQDVTHFRWLTRERALSAIGVTDPNLCPLYIFFGGN